MEAYNANYVGGDINGGVQDLRQLFTRPVARRGPLLHAGPAAVPLLVLDAARRRGARDVRLLRRAGGVARNLGDRRTPVGSRSVSQQRVSYAGAGVDIEAGDRAVELMKAWVAKASRPEVVGGIGGFAGLFDASALKAYRRPLLATSTDGVGTKVAVAAAVDRHDTIGHDLVGMVVDDLVVCGAEPLFMTDYIACGKVVPERIAAIVKGIAEGCVLAGCALLGGETAEHPGLLGPDEYDVAGAGTGVVEADRLLGADRVRAGDVLVAMASSGLHSNGYSLVRHVLLRAAPAGSWTARCDELGRSLVDELLEPTRIYARDCLALIDGRRRPRVQPRHRGRAGGQPGPGAARRPRRHRGPGDLVTGAGLRAGPGRRRGARRRARAHAEHGRRHGRGGRRRRGRPRGASCSPDARSPPGCSAQWATATALSPSRQPPA